MNSTQVVSSTPLLGILGIIFITLKLAEIGVVATWSWWLVLLPFWLIPAIVLCVVAVIGVVYLLANLMKLK